MSPRVIFRYLSPEDKEQYLFLLRELGDVKVTKSQWKAFLQEYDESNKEIWLGEIHDITHGNIVACTASLITDFKIHNRFNLSGYITDFSVHPRYRGLGIGSALMTHLIKQAKAMTAFEIYVNSPLPKEFLTKFGFVDSRLELE